MHLVYATRWDVGGGTGGHAGRHGSGGAGGPGGRGGSGCSWYVRAMPLVFSIVADLHRKEQTGTRWQCSSGCTAGSSSSTAVVPYGSSSQLRNGPLALQIHSGGISDGQN